MIQLRYVVQILHCRILIDASRSASIAFSSARFEALLSIVAVSATPVPAIVLVVLGDERVPRGAESQVNRGAALIDGLVKVIPFAVDLDIGVAGSTTAARGRLTDAVPTVCAVDLRPAAVVAVPVPVTSDAADRFPALRFPVCFTSWSSRPIIQGALLAPQHDKPVSRGTVSVPHTANAYASACSRSSRDMSPDLPFPRGPS